MNEDSGVYGHEGTVSVYRTITGGESVRQLWVLSMRGEPGTGEQHSIIKCYYIDGDHPGGEPNRDAEHVLKDSQVGGWEDAPEEVQVELSRLAPAGTMVLSEGGTVRILNDGWEKASAQ